MPKVKNSPEVRRARVFGGVGIVVYGLALLLSWGAYGVVVWRDESLLAYKLEVALGLIPLILILVARPYWRLTSAQRMSLGEVALRLLILLLLWLGSLWHLLVFAYLGVELALGSGLMMSFIDQ